MLPLLQVPVPAFVQGAGDSPYVVVHSLVFDHSEKRAGNSFCVTPLIVFDLSFLLKAVPHLLVSAPSNGGGGNPFHVLPPYQCLRLHLCGRLVILSM